MIRKVGWVLTFVVIGITLVLLGMGCKANLDGERPTAEKPLGGNVTNTKESAEDVKFYKSWGKGPKGNATILEPGEKSTGDADGFCIPKGWNATVRIFTIGVPGWTTQTLTGCHKITDIQSAEVTVS